MASLWFQVHGTPVQQGSKTPGKRNDGSLFVRENAKGLKPWRKVVADAAIEAAATLHMADTWDGFQPDEPLHLSVYFWYEPIKSDASRLWKWTAPDLDKLVRAIGDALQQSGVIKDDSRIVSIEAVKRYDKDGPGARIRVCSIDER